MKNNLYFENILSFKDKFYPGNNVNFDTSEYRTMFYIINENITLCEILIEYKSTINIGSKQGIQIIYLLKNCFQRFIIALMNNDDYYIGFLLRGISELLLKLILVQNSSGENFDIMKESYRFLNEKIDQLNFTDEEKDLIHLLRVFFSKYSDVVHINDNPDQPSIIYLTDLISDHSIELKNISSEHNHINKIFYKVIFKHSGLTFSRLGTIERTKLSDIVKRKKLEKIMQYLA